MKDNGKNNSVVYIHYKKDTNEVFYVGIGSPNRPWCNIRSNNWKEYTKGIEYEVEVVGDNLSYSEAYEIEKSLISKYGRINMGTGTLVNLTDGGLGTHGLSKESRQKMSNSRMGEKNGMFGRTRSQYVKNRVSESNKGSGNGMFGKTISKEAMELKRLNSRRKNISDERYFELVNDLKGILYNNSSYTSRDLASKYEVNINFVVNHKKKVKNNNIII